MVIHCPSINTSVSMSSFSPHDRSSVWAWKSFYRLSNERWTLNNRSSHTLTSSWSAVIIDLGRQGWSASVKFSLSQNYTDSSDSTMPIKFMPLARYVIVQVHKNSTLRLRDRLNGHWRLWSFQSSMQLEWPWRYSAWKPCGFSGTAVAIDFTNYGAARLRLLIIVTVSSHIGCLAATIMNR